MPRSDLGVFHDGFEVVRRADQDQEPERERGAAQKSAPPG
jgi:hypothetical protein